MRRLTGESRTRASAALAIVGVAGVLSAAACGKITGGSDNTADTAAPAVRHAATATASPGASPGASAPAPTSVAAGAASPADLTEITQLVRSVELAHKVGDICRAKLSAKLVLTVFKSVRRCEHTWDTPNGGILPTDVTVSDIRVTGAAATATLVEHGGLFEGATGTWAFLRSGQTWRVAALGVDYLRSQERTGYAHYTSTDPADLLGYQPVRDCLVRKSDRLSDEEFTTRAYASMREDKAAELSDQEDLTACAAVPDAQGVSTLRRLVEIGIKQGLEKQKLGALLDCAISRERAQISDAEILAAYKRFRKVGTYPPDFLSKAYRIGFNCGAEAAAGQVGTRT